MGDWNGRVGRDINRGMGNHWERIVNKTRIKMIDFINNLIRSTLREL